LREVLSADDLALLLATQADYQPSGPTYNPPRPPGPPRGTSKVMRLEIESADGSNVRVNLPVGLANFAIKLIPREAQAALTERGLDVASLTELLQGDVPDGEVINVEGADGSTLRLRVE
jgi:hypothetical protein